MTCVTAVGEGQAILARLGCCQSGSEGWQRNCSGVHHVSDADVLCSRSSRPAAAAASR